MEPSTCDPGGKTENLDVVFVERVLEIIIQEMSKIWSRI